MIRNLLLFLVCVSASACAGTDDGCKRDTDCRAPRVCESGMCVSPSSGPDAGIPAGLVEGAACSTPDALACSQGEDRSTALRCTNGRFEKAFSCPNLQQCHNVEGYTSVSCGFKDSGTPYAEVDTRCARDGAAACTLSKAEILECVSGTWIVGVHCPPSECISTNHVVQCANGGVSVGDRCRGAVGAVSCSTDSTKILTCSNGRAEVYQDCGAQGRRCAVNSQGSLFCG